MQYRQVHDGVIGGLGQRVGQQIGLANDDAWPNGKPGPLDHAGVPVHRVQLGHSTAQLGGEQTGAAASVAQARRPGRQPPQDQPVVVGVVVPGEPVNVRQQDHRASVPRHTAGVMARPEMNSLRVWHAGSTDRPVRRTSYGNGRPRPAGPPPPARQAQMGLRPISVRPARDRAW